MKMSIYTKPVFTFAEFKAKKPGHKVYGVPFGHPQNYWD